MARKRQIDPGIWTSEQFINLQDPWARLLFIGIFSNADDEGRLKASPAYLKTIVFPGDTVTVQQVLQWRDMLIGQGLIQVYANGTEPIEYLSLPTWKKYQYISKPYPSKLPAPPANIPIPPPNHSDTIPALQHTNGIGIGIGIGIDNEDQAPKKSPDPLQEEGKLIFEGLKKRRGYNSGVAGAEAKAITWMLKQGYSAAQQLAAYDKLKKDKFWADKFLNMQTVKAQIGELLKAPGKPGGLPTQEQLLKGWGKKT